MDLILLRHAAAMAASPDGTDASRPLSPLGETEARAAGAWLHEHGVKPGRVLCSPAQRTLMTARTVLQCLGDDAEPTLESGIYEAAPGTLITLLEPHADVDTLLLVGHNPGLEQLVGLLTEGISSASRGMPPAGLAWLHTPVPLQPGQARLHAFWSP